MLTLSHINKSFGPKTVLHDISFQAEDGEVVALLGPSGCGKTTLLRIIAGLETADQGQISLDGQELTSIPVYRRGFGMVFQDYALFPHKTAAENIAFGLRMAGWTAEERRGRVEHLLELVGLPGMGGRSVYDLSGGEQQRVALARALAPAPRLLLLDEPLGALDRTIRERLLDELRAILQRAAAESEDGRKVTTIYVTHDQEEAFAVAGRIMIMNQGRIEQSGTPPALYRSPGTPFVARFLGMENLLEGTVIGRTPCTIQTEIGLIEIEGDCPAEAGEAGILLIRPEAAEIIPPGREMKNRLAAELLDVSFRGRYQIAEMAVTHNGRTTHLKFSFDMEQLLAEAGGVLHLSIAPDKCLFYKQPLNTLPPPDN